MVEQSPADILIQRASLPGRHKTSSAVLTPHLTSAPSDAEEGPPGPPRSPQARPQHPPNTHTQASPQGLSLHVSPGQVTVPALQCPGQRSPAPPESLHSHPGPTGHGESTVLREGSAGSRTASPGGCPPLPSAHRGPAAPCSQQAPGEGEETSGEQMTSVQNTQRWEGTGW